MFAEKNGLSFLETSALDSTNVETAFQTILTGKCEAAGSVWAHAVDPYQPCKVEDDKHLFLVMDVGIDEY